MKIRKEPPLLKFFRGKFAQSIKYRINQGENQKYVEIPLKSFEFNDKVRGNYVKRKSGLSFNSYRSIVPSITLESANNSIAVRGVSEFRLSGVKRIVFYISSILLFPALVIATGIYFFLSGSALYTVNLRYEYQNLSIQKQIDVKNSPNSLFTTTVLSAEEGITVSGEATGQKIVGNKASGYISVFNATTEVKLIKKGTSVTCISAACNGLIYIVDSDLNLGPGSSATDLKIIAADIGENYNLAINEGRFKISNFNPNTEIVALNIQPLTGGTPKKIVKTVTASDLKNLEEKAMKDLKSILLTKITTDPNNSTKYIFSNASFKIEKLSSDGDKENAETEIVNLTVRAKGTIEAIPISNIMPIIQEIKSTIAPEGYYLDEKTFTYTIDSSSSGDNFLINITAKGIGRINLDIKELKSKIAGKSLKESENILKSIPNISGVNTDYAPQLMPEFLRKVPNNHDKIQIRLIAEDPKTSNQL